jgi:hypothetical protein
MPRNKYKVYSVYRLVSYRYYNPDIKIDLVRMLPAAYENNISLNFLQHELHLNNISKFSSYRTQRTLRLNYINQPINVA